MQQYLWRILRGGVYGFLLGVAGTHAETQPFKFVALLVALMVLSELRA